MPREIDISRRDYFDIRQDARRNARLLHRKEIQVARGQVQRLKANEVT
jgi:ribosomal protein S1